MSKLKHAPAPWRILEDGERTYIVDANGRLVAQIARRIDLPEGAEPDYAGPIAATPDLLEACMSMAHEASLICMSDPKAIGLERASRKAVAAIVKAIGECDL